MLSSAGSLDTDENNKSIGSHSAEHRGSDLTVPGSLRATRDNCVPGFGAVQSGLQRRRCRGGGGGGY